MSDSKDEKDILMSVYITDHPQKGKILRARRHIKAGELALEDKPIVVAQQEDSSDGLEAVIDEMYKKKTHVSFELAAWLFRCAFQYATKPKHIQEVMLSLFCPDENEQFHEDARDVLNDPRVKRPEGIDTETLVKLVKIANGNAYSYDGNNVAVALYQYAPRISHSCSPNSVWDSENGRYVLRTVRDIEPDEEITICYARTSFRPTYRRRDHLKVMKSFYCLCERCSKPDDTRGVICTSCNQGTIFLQTPTQKTFEEEEEDEEEEEEEEDEEEEEEEDTDMAPVKKAKTSHSKSKSKSKSKKQSKPSKKASKKQQQDNEAQEAKRQEREAKQAEWAEMEARETCNVCGSAMSKARKASINALEDQLCEALQVDLDESNDYSDVKEQIYDKVSVKLARKALRLCDEAKFAKQNWLRAFAHERLADFLADKEDFAAAERHLRLCIEFQDIVCPFVNTTISWNKETRADLMLGALSPLLYPGMRGEDSEIPMSDEVKEMVQEWINREDEKSTRRSSLRLKDKEEEQKIVDANGRLSLADNKEIPEADSLSRVEIRAVIIEAVKHFTLSLSMNRLMNDAEHFDITTLEAKLEAMKTLFPQWYDEAQAMEA